MKSPLATYWARATSGGLDFRNTQIAKGAIGTVFHRGTSIAVNLVTVPVLYNYLGREVFGVVMALLAVGIAMSFGDLGIGNGLQNHIAAIQDDRARVATVLKTGALYAAMVAAVLFVAVAVALRFTDLQRVFGTDVLGHNELSSLVLVLVGCLAVQVPLSLGQRVLAAYQRLHVHAAYLTGASIATLAGILACAYVGAPASYVVVALVAPAVVANGCALVHAIRIMDLPIISSGVDLTGKLVDDVLLTGLVFFTVQAAWTLHILTDSLFVSARLGAGVLADYSIVMRAIALLVLPISALVAPLLGSLNDALAKADYAWLRTSLRRVTRIALLNVVLTSAAFFALVEPLLELWIGRDFDLPAGTLLSYTAVLVFQCLSIPLSVALMTAPLLRKGAVYYVIAVGVATAAKWSALGFGGIAAFNFASAAALFALYVLPCGYVAYDILYRRRRASPLTQTSPPD